MDLLSLVEGGSLEAENGKAATPPVPVPANGVYYLPVPQTAVQKDLVEVLFKLHRHHLVKMLKANSDLKHEEMGSYATQVLTSKNMLELLIINMKLINTHVTLLVKHFMPRKLLLMESHQQIAIGSGKFVALDRFLSELEPVKKTVLICARGVKELDLVEGLMIGRKLNYKRFTGTSLYDQESTSKQVIQKKYRSIVHKKAKLQVGGSNGKEESEDLKKSKRKKITEDDYVPRKSKNHPDVSLLEQDFSCEIFLVLSDQVSQMTGSVDLIISLDPFLSVDSASIHVLRTSNSRPSEFKDKAVLAPVVKFVTLNSVEHVMLNVPGFESGDLLPLVGEEELEQLVQIVGCNRGNVETYDESKPSEHFDGLGNWLEDPLTNKWSGLLELPKPEAQFPEDKESLEATLTRDFSEGVYEFDHKEVLPESNGDGNGTKKLKTEHTSLPDFTYEEYLKQLTTLVLERFEKVGHLLEKGKKLSQAIKNRETQEQAAMEDNNERIGLYYKELKESEVKASALERRAERLDGDHIKISKIEQALVQRLETLKSQVQSLESDSQPTLFEEQEAEIEKLKLQVETITSHIETTSAELESFRTKYQEKSSEAAGLSQKVTSLESKRDSLLKESNGLSTSLRQLLLDDAKLSYNEECELLRRKNEFLTAYAHKIGEMVKEKNSTVLSRGIRVSRSSTPYAG
ncbi:unnamed protein product [Kuraishia capsulata CBS 1993]|uniref:HDA1 complex subunit 2 n=1 Tax=Kuraishia capsulata CBS 1993 TaxID=1382522 RepID=W6MGN2_9ASCO|nr:uncharacterized protein KUCA_T00000679001 [Kuraishia capsulata CBS 1993]CDK24713.1 unnamed protein product [Kuraishia capsulata CBS 1993]